MGKKKEEVAPEGPSVKDFKAIIASLNVFLKKKKVTLCVIGKNKTTMTENFQACIEGLDDKVSAKLPEKVIDFYNENFGEEEDADEEEVADEEEEKPAKKKTDKKKDDKKADKKKDKKPKQVSNEQMAVDMMDAGDSEKAILAAFTKRYKDRGQTDKDYVAGRVAIYIHIAKGKLGIASEPPTKKKGDKPADKKADKKSTEKKADKSADKKPVKKTSKKKGKKKGKK